MSNHYKNIGFFDIRNKIIIYAYLPPLIHVSIVYKKEVASPGESRNLATFCMS